MPGVSIYRCEHDLEIWKKFMDSCASTSTWFCMHDACASTPSGLHEIHSLGFDLPFVKSAKDKPNSKVLTQLPCTIAWLLQTSFRSLSIKLCIGWLPSKVQHSKVGEEIKIPSPWKTITSFVPNSWYYGQQALSSKFCFQLEWKMELDLKLFSNIFFLAYVQPQTLQNLV